MPPVDSILTFAPLTRETVVKCHQVLLSYNPTNYSLNAPPQFRANRQYGGNMGSAPSSPSKMFNGPQQQGVMPGYGAPLLQGYPGHQTGMQMPGFGGLPPGWESKVLPNGRTVYIDHNTQVCRLPTVHATVGGRMQLKFREAPYIAPSLPHQTLVFESKNTTFNPAQNPHVDTCYDLGSTMCVKRFPHDGGP